MANVAIVGAGAVVTKDVAAFAMKAAPSVQSA